MCPKLLGVKSLCAMPFLAEPSMAVAMSSTTCTILLTLADSRQAALKVSPQQVY